MDDVTVCNLALARLGDARIVTLADATPEGQFCSLFYSPTLEEVLRSHPWSFATVQAKLRLNWRALSGTALANNGSGLVRVTFTSHGLTTGMEVRFKEVEGVPLDAETYNITVINANTFDLAGSVFSGAHVSGTGSFLRVPLFHWDYLYSLPSDVLRIVALNGYSENEPRAKWEVKGGILMTNEETADIEYVSNSVSPTVFDSIFVEALSLKLAAKLAKPLTGSSKIAEDALVEYQRVVAPLAKSIDSSEGNALAKPSWVTSDLVRSRYPGE